MDGMGIFLGVCGLLLGFVAGAWFARRRPSEQAPGEALTSEKPTPLSDEEPAAAKVASDEPAPDQEADEPSGEDQAQEAAQALEKAEEEHQRKLAALEATNAELTSRVEEAEIRGRRYHRWATNQMGRMTAELEQRWQEAGLATRVHELAEALPSPTVVSRLRNSAQSLSQWIDELGLGTAEVYFQIGLCHTLAQDLEKAAEAFHEATSRGLGVEALLAQGDSLWLLDQRTKACKSYRQCLHRPETPHHVYHRYAQVAIADCNFKEGLAALDHILEHDNNPVEVYALASLACGKLKDYERAVAICSRGLGEHQESALLHANMIIPLSHLGENERARQMYERAVALDPELADGPFALGVAVMHQGRDEDALELFDEALKLRPEYAEVFFCLGVIRNRKNEFKPALEHFERAVELKPDYAEAYYHMNESYKGLRDFENAIAVLNRAVQLNPDYE